MGKTYRYDSAEDYARDARADLIHWQRVASDARRDVRNGDASPEWLAYCVGRVARERGRVIELEYELATR